MMHTALAWTCCCNRIKAFGVWEFQALASMHSLPHHSRALKSIESCNLDPSSTGLRHTGCSTTKFLDGLKLECHHSL